MRADYRDASRGRAPGNRRGARRSCSRACAPLAAEQVPVAAAAGRVLARGRARARRPAAVRELGDGRVRGARGGDARDAAVVGSVGRRAAAEPRRSLPARRSRSRPAPSFPPAPTRSCRSSGRERDGDAVEIERCQAGATRPSARRRRSRRATSSSRRAARSGRCRSARSPRPGSTTVRVRAPPARRRARDRAASCARRASRSAPGEIYESNTALLAAQLAAAGADAERARRRSPTTRTRRARRSRAGSRRTC